MHFPGVVRCGQGTKDYKSMHSYKKTNVRNMHFASEIWRQLKRLASYSD